MRKPHVASVAALGLWGPREVREACDPLTIETPLSAHEAGAAGVAGHKVKGQDGAGCPLGAQSSKP